MSVCVLSGIIFVSEYSSRLCVCVSDRLVGSRRRAWRRTEGPGATVCDPVSEGWGGAATPAPVSMPRGHQ